ncbi:hypothetical protein IW262DRAFT_1478552 [Armillaria fumosa]|nr:hypothetical protein IW262DRAFT_1478552 [Armillaria fumosa]
MSARRGDPQTEAMDEPVVDSKTYHFVVEGVPHIADVQCGDTRTSVNPEESWNLNRDVIASRDGGTCVILETAIVEYLDDFAHRCRTVRWVHRSDKPGDRNRREYPA